MNKMTKVKTPILLVIVDGWGLAPSGPGNAISLAKMQCVENWKKSYPWVKARASGQAVGLPANQMGNSEVGHMHIGAGRICWGSLSRINQAINNHQLDYNSALRSSINFCQKHTGRFHFWGLLSDGGVHSNWQHLFALVKIVVRCGVKHVYFHLVADGRDTQPRTFLTYWRKLKNLIAELGVGELVSVAGRFYAMDRDKRFDRTNQALKAMICGQGNSFSSLEQYINDRYLAGESDEFLTPGVNANCPAGLIQTNDVVLAFNFRIDRVIQLSATLSNPHYLWRPQFTTPQIFLATMTDYDQLVSANAILFPRPVLNNCLGSWLSKQGYHQLRAAETEKIAHVTFFFDGGYDYFANGLAKPDDIKLRGADILLVPSPKVATYDLQPAMSCELLTDKIIQRLYLRSYDLIVLNFANPDMVGHTGVLAATVKANQVLDRCLQRLQKAVTANHGLMIVTADHGNAEEMINQKTKEVNKKHTTNFVPIFVLDHRYRLRTDARIADLAPTILFLMGITPPPEMKCHNLIRL